MVYNNSLSTISLEDDFRDVLNEAKDFIKDREESKCVINHVNDNTLNEIKEEISNCRNVYDTEMKKNLRLILEGLISMGAVDSLSKSRTYRLTKIGKRLLEETKDPYSSK